MSFARCARSIHSVMVSFTGDKRNAKQNTRWFGLANNVDGRRESSGTEPAGTNVSAHVTLTQSRGNR